MVERTDRSAVATFFSPEPFSTGASLTLGEDVAQHVRATRLAVGAAIGLRDGAGGIGLGTLARIGKSAVVVSVSTVTSAQRPPAIHLLAPVADRERMLFLAEKTTELGIASWRPIMWRRSKSVSPRGEGPTFQSKLKSRMVSALIQSGGAWLPDIFPEATVESAVAATPAGTRLLLDKGGSGVGLGAAPPISIALGPEGGIEDAERTVFLEHGFQPLRLAATTLRFETAGIAAVAVCLQNFSKS